MTDLAHTSEPGVLAKVRAAHRTAVMIRYAMIVSLAVFIIIVEIMNRRDSSLNVGSDFEAIRFVFLGISILLVFGTSVIRGLLMRKPSRDLDGLVAKLSSTNVITAGMAEAPVIMGLVLFLMDRQYADFYMLAFVSLYLLLRHFPRYAQWESLAREHAGDSPA